MSGFPERQREEGGCVDELPGEQSSKGQAVPLRREQAKKKKKSLAETQLKPVTQSHGQDLSSGNSVVLRDFPKKPGFTCQAEQSMLEAH